MESLQSKSRSLVATLCLLHLIAVGCGSMPTGEKIFIAASLADTATTTYGLSAKENFYEAGLLHGLWDDDGAAIASVVIMDAAIIWFAHRLYKRYPKWAGWPALWHSSIASRGLAAVRNLHSILEGRQ